MVDLRLSIRFAGEGLSAWQDSQEKSLARDHAADGWAINPVTIHAQRERARARLASWRGRFILAPGRPGRSGDNSASLGLRLGVEWWPGYRIGLRLRRRHGFGSGCETDAVSA